jgi:hypothetical protein
LAQGEQRNKWQGPAGGGKDAVYAGCELEPTQWSATEAGSAFQLGFFSGSLPPFSVFALFCSSIFWPSVTSAVRTRAISLVLGLSFYPLEQAPNMVIYAMSKSGDSNERSNLSCGFVRPSAIEDARRCCQKIHLRTSGFKFQWLPSFF